MFRIRESTCGDAILAKFGYHPQENDNIVSVVRAFGGEDRNHVAIMFTLCKEKTRICTNANCYTDPPRSWKVFLSQRRRWSLSTQTNNLITIFGRGQNIWERFCSCIDILVWLIPVFIFVTIAQVIRAFVFHNNWQLLVGLSSIILLPWFWALANIIWLPTDGKDRLRFMGGLVLLFFCASFVNLVVTTYTVWNMTDYSWGKTRQLSAEDEKKNMPVPIAADEQQDVNVDVEKGAPNFEAGIEETHAITRRDDRLARAMASVDVVVPEPETARLSPIREMPVRRSSLINQAVQRLPANPVPTVVAKRKLPSQASLGTLSPLTNVTSRSSGLLSPGSIASASTGVSSPASGLFSPVSAGTMSPMSSIASPPPTTDHGDFLTKGK